MGGTVAIVGAGPAGIAAIKALREEGFEPTCFERRSDVGGLWTYDTTPEFTSATLHTKAQISKYVCSFTDMPFSDDTPLHVNAEQWSQYFKDYTRHFDLYKHIVFNVSVSLVQKDKTTGKWMVHIKGEKEPRAFDKVIVASGTENIAQYPKIEGIEKFEGTFIHGQAFKRGEDFKDKNVVVLGMGNSAGDVAVEVQPFASKTYLAHRRGAKIIPRLSKIGPIDNSISWTLSRIGYRMEYYAPRLFNLAVDALFGASIKEAWGTDTPEGFEGSPSAGLGAASIVVNDHLVPLVRAGKIESVQSGIQRVLGPRKLEMESGRIIEDVDAIIACTGYEPDFGMLPDVTLVQKSDDKGTTAKGAQGKSPGGVPELYQLIFPPEHADSLACLNYAALNDNAATFRELSALAVAQVWAGKAQLPSVQDMKREAAGYRRWLWAFQAKNPGVGAGTARSHTFSRFLHDAAGTGMYEHVGWSAQAWRLWWTDRELYRMIAWGVMAPYMFRLFETGKRRTWDGAREALVKVNEMRDREWPKKGRKETVQGLEGLPLAA